MQPLLHMKVHMRAWIYRLIASAAFSSETTVAQDHDLNEEIKALKESIADLNRIIPLLQNEYRTAVSSRRIQRTYGVLASYCGFFGACVFGLMLPQPQDSFKLGAVVLAVAVGIPGFVWSTLPSHKPVWGVPYGSHLDLHGANTLTKNRSEESMRAAQATVLNRIDTRRHLHSLVEAATNLWIAWELRDHKLRELEALTHQSSCAKILGKSISGP